MIWKNRELNRYPDIILSDCKVIDIQVKENKITVNFSEDGFFVKDSERKSYYRTDTAQLVMESCDVANISIKEIRTQRLSEELYYDSMYDVESQDFIENINTGKWRLEIVEEFYSVGGGVYSVRIRCNESPFWCYIKLQFKNLVYMWNDIRYDYPL